MPDAKVFDATPTFERMRALKTPEELTKLPIRYLSIICYPQGNQGD